MPRIPIYDQKFAYKSVDVPGPRLKGFDVQTSAAMFGAESGKNLERAGKKILEGSTTLATLYNDYNNTKAHDASNKMQQGFLEWQAEAQGKKGEHGMETATDYDVWSKKQKDSLTKGMNDIQRGRFEALAQSQMSGQRYWAENYGREQGDVFNNATLQTKVSTNKDTLMANLGNPELAGQAIEGIKDASFLMGDSRGLGAEATKRLMFENVEQSLVPGIYARIEAGDLGTATGAMQHYKLHLGSAATTKLNSAIAKQRESLRAKWEAEKEKQALENEYISINTQLGEMNLGSLEAKTEAAYMLADKIEDRGTRNRVLGMVSADLKFEDIKLDARASREVREFNALKDREGWTPGQALLYVKNAEKISERGKEQLLANLSKDGEKETPQNKKALAQLREQVDLGTRRGGIDPQDSDTLEAEAFRNGLNSKQTEALLKHAAEGGTPGQLKQSQVSRLWKELSRGKKDMPEDLHELVQDSLKPGESLTDNNVRAVIARLELYGETGGVYASWGYGKDETLADAKRKGRDAKWAPEMAPKIREQLEKEMLEAGVEDISPARVTEYYLSKKDAVAKIKDEKKNSLINDFWGY